MKRKDLRNEAEYLPNSLEELVRVRERVLALGESRRIADGLCMWLIAKANGESDTTGADTRSKYRRILRELGTPEPVGGGRRRARGDAGLVDAVAVATTSRRGLAAAAVTVLLDVTRTAGDDAGDELEPAAHKASGGADVHTLRPRRVSQGVLELHTPERLAKAS